MNKKEFYEKLKIEFKDLDIKYIENKINLYISLINEYNQKFNLTRLNGDDVIYKSFLYDSIIPYKFIDFSEIRNILDIGSGSGIPGILIKIFFKNIHLTIVESNSKKCFFLNEVVNKLHLENVKIINARMEEYAHLNKNKFDMVTCRAVARLKMIVELSCPVTKINGIMVFPKSKNYLMELDESKEIIDIFKLNDYQILNYDDDKINRVFIFKKTEQSPKKYPRPWKDIIK